MRPSTALSASRLMGAHGSCGNSLKNRSVISGALTQQVNALYSLSRMIATTTDFDALLQRLAEAAAFLSRADQSALFFSTSRGAPLMLAAHNAPLKPAPVPLNASPAAHVLRTLQTTVLDSNAARQLMPEGPPLGTLAYVPMVANTRRIGVLSVATYAKKQTFSQGDRRLLTILGGMAAQAILSRQLEGENRRPSEP